eukprot:Gb_00579 [translate_table: standard]
MEGASDPSKGRTFSIDLSSEGAARLREAVKQKLSEFMGSYTDDVLAEYVAVLVCHGKHQDQAKKDLDAFLGDHSSAFVAWLWDHIASNMHLYVTSAQSSQPGVVNEQEKINSDEHAKKNSEKQTKRSADLETLSKGNNGALISNLTHTEVNERPTRATESRRRREWIPSEHKALREAKETPRLQTNCDERDEFMAGENFQLKGKLTLKRQHSPEAWIRRERFRQDERHANKRTSPPPAVDAPRRLLQSAVREAVGPVGSGNLRKTETVSKRLRSVVSTAVENPDASLDTVEAPHRPKALVRSVPAMAVAMKAAAAAAEDVARVRSAGSVFDRLGKRLDRDFNGLQEVVDEHMADNGNNIENTMTESDYQEHEYQQRSEINSRSGSRLQGRLSRGFVDDVAMMENESIVPSDPTTDSEGYDEGEEDARYMHAYASASRESRRLENRENDGSSRLSTFKERQPLQVKQPDKRPEESVTVQYRLARNSDEMARENRIQNASSSGLSNASRKIVNISVNVNTWKPPHFRPARDPVDGETRTSTGGLKLLPDHTDMDVDGSLPDDTDMGLQAEGGQSVPIVDPNDVSGADFCSNVRKVTPSSSTSGTHTAVRPSEDTDSRTVFVTNVHFAATKETLSKHFNRCGDVVKVIILTDAATGQPKGSAYVEFARKETAEMALTLNETSFMSRMLKVVRKNTSALETSMLARPPLRRPFVFGARPPVRAPYARGFPIPYRRGYMPRASSSRNLQWRRDASAGAVSDNSVASLNEPPAATSSVPIFSGNPGVSVSSRLQRPLTYIRTPTKTSSENPGPRQD